MNLKDLVEKGLIKEIRHKQVMEAEPSLYQVIPQQKACDDCNKIVTDRRVSYSKRQTPKAHVRIKCTGCNLYKNPNTNKFECDSTQIESIWRDYFQGMHKY